MFSILIQKHMRCIKLDKFNIYGLSYSCIIPRNNLKHIIQDHYHHQELFIQNMDINNLYSISLLVHKHSNEDLLNTL